MNYRTPSSPSEEHDPEELALRTLRERVAATRRRVHVPLLLASLVASGFLYVALRDWQYASRGGHFPFVTAIFAFVPTFGLALKGAPWLADRVVRSLLPRWRRALAKEHGLDLAELEEMTRLLE